MIKFLSMRPTVQTRQTENLKTQSDDYRKESMIKFPNMKLPTQTQTEDLTQAIQHNLSVSLQYYMCN